MILTTVDDQIHIRADTSRKMVGVAKRVDGGMGVIQIKQRDEICDVDLIVLLREMGHGQLVDEYLKRCNLTNVNGVK